MKLAISILSSNYNEEETIKKINETDGEYIHLDVADGHFVQTKTPEYEFLSIAKKPIDVHLMVAHAFEYISLYANIPNVENITIHVELEDNLKELLNYIKTNGKKCGLAVSPETPLSSLEEYYDTVDIILLMLVNPGKGGQEMILECVDKLKELILLREKRGYKFKIIVDGGVNDKTLVYVADADIIVSGSFICKSEDYQEQINKLRLSKQ